ncbi:RNA polymerase subunit RPABC4/transcription elongation factor Spt4 [Cellvibrio fibrivorans]|uniref:RNA polymerase subunit RPABC4/transcription elongation factor Spt4 n=1 Tax=Cellvibrio fibrivorans TaxID=126350 RepID=A0ABU1V1U3_9GAMM|nr:RNA polymerase subunit RPABC4/transcription elongation factor Spt4 [Cellvibrio fibrivorans]
MSIKLNYQRNCPVCGSHLDSKSGWFIFSSRNYKCEKCEILLEPTTTSLWIGYVVSLFFCFLIDKVLVFFDVKYHVFISLILVLLMMPLWSNRLERLKVKAISP